MDSGLDAEATRKRIAEGGGSIQNICASPDVVSRRCEDDFSSTEGDEADETSSSEDEPEPVVRKQRIRRSAKKKPRKAPVPRALVDELHIVTLMRAYRFEFTAFSRGKKRTPKQMIPGKVWEKVYNDHFLVAFPNSGFSEDTLRKHLRDQVVELAGAAGTGVADDGHTPLLQDDVLANQVRQSDCAATRNILRLRRSLSGGPPPAPAPPSAPASSSAHALTSAPTSAPPSIAPPPFAPPPVAPTAEGSMPPPLDPPIARTASASPAASVPPIASTAAAQSNASGTTSAGSHRPTKSEVLVKQADAVGLIAQDFHATAESQRQLMDAKKVRHQILAVEKAREYGLLTEDQFKAKLSAILEL